MMRFTQMMRVPCLRGIVFCSLVGMMLSPAQVQGGGLALQQNLAELVGAAATIVRGQVVSVRSEPHPEFNNLQTIVVTLKVGEILKGEPVETFTFRQFVPDMRDRQTLLGYKLKQEVLLMMINPSEFGLSSPAGLAQGRFRILRDPIGNAMAVNGANNMGLFRNINKTTPKLGSRLESNTREFIVEHRGGPIAYDQLVNIIHSTIAVQP